MDLEFLVKRTGEGYRKVEALKDGKAVSWLYVVDLELHYGVSRIRTGGVAGVYTPREHRGKGYSAATVRYALEWMKREGYQLSALFGIPEYYHRFGFLPFMGEHVVSLSLRSLSRVDVEGVEWELSEDPGYRHEFTGAVYESVNTRWPASRVRDPEKWKGFRKGVSWEHPPRTLIVELNGKPAAYAAVERWPSPEELVVAEVGALDHDPIAYRAVMKALYELALEQRKSSVIVHAPFDHPFADVARVYGATVKSTYSWSGGGMARVVRLYDLLEAIRSELESRSKGLEGEVTLEVEGEAVTLRARDGSLKLEESARSVNVVKLGAGEAAQLILGYRDPFELLSAAETHGRVGVCVKLFPKSTPYVWQPDRW